MGARGQYQLCESSHVWPATRREMLPDTVSFISVSGTIERIFSDSSINQICCLAPANVKDKVSLKVVIREVGV